MKLKQTNKLKTVIVSEENISYTIRKAEKSESNKLTNQNFTENVAVFSLLNTILLFITKKKTSCGSLFSNISVLSTVHQLGFTSS